MKVSVFVVTYNQEKLIGQCLDSIISQQTGFDFEIVIGDDFSQDGTREVCLGYARQHDNVRVLESTQNVGVVANWIKVLSACNGEYIALCEGDDYWTDPYKLRKQVDILDANKQYDMCVTNRKILNPEGELTDDIYEQQIFTNADILKGVIPHTQTMLIRNTDNRAMCAFLAEMLAGLSSGCDRILAYWYSRSSYIYVLPDITAVYRWSGTGVWTNYGDIDREYHDIRLFEIFHSRLHYPRRDLFNDVFSAKCLNFIYYSIRRRQHNPYKAEVIGWCFRKLPFFYFMKSVLSFGYGKLFRKKNKSR